MQNFLSILDLNPDSLAKTPNFDALGRDSLNFSLAVPEAMPPCDALINPHQQACGLPFKGLCSAGVILTTTLAYTFTGVSNVRGSNFNDVITGSDSTAGPPFEFFEGRAGNDTIYGGEGSDTISALDGNDRFYGEAGNDTLIAGAAFGLPGTNILDGGPGNDVLRGARGDDTLIGGSGDDSLDGGAGVDLLLGDSGSDLYLFGNGYGFDTVEDLDVTPADLEILGESCGSGSELGDSIAIGDLDGDGRLDITATGNTDIEVRRARAADMFLKADKYADAVKYLTAAETLAANSDESEMVLAARLKTYQAEGSLDEHTQKAEDNAKVTEPNAEQLYLLARFYEAQRKYPEAAAAIQRSLALDAKRLPSLATAARIHERAVRLWVWQAAPGHGAAR